MNNNTGYHLKFFFVDLVRQSTQKYTEDWEGEMNGTSEARTFNNESITQSSTPAKFYRLPLPLDRMPCRVGFSVPGLDPGGPGSGSRKIPLLAISKLFVYCYHSDINFTKCGQVLNHFLRQLKKKKNSMVSKTMYGNTLKII